MTKNLRTTRYNDGTLISNINNFTDWENTDLDSTGAWSWYDTLNSNDMEYGKLYNWYVVDTISNGNRNVCPTGWHVPSEAEWQVLTDFLLHKGFGYEGSGIDIAKSTASTMGWMTDETPGNVGNVPAENNRSGFTGNAGGARRTDGTFTNMGRVGYWWSSTESGAGAWIRSLRFDMDIWINSVPFKKEGRSIHCIKD